MLQLSKTINSITLNNLSRYFKIVFTSNIKLIRTSAETLTLKIANNLNEEKRSKEVINRVAKSN